MRQQVLKALANPSRIFFVPYSLAVLNFAVQFAVFITIFTISLAANGFTESKVDPLYFLISVIIVHSAMIGFSKREPQIANIISAKLQLFKFKIPKRLIG